MKSAQHNMHMASCSVIKFYSPVTCGSVYLLSRTGRACPPTTANATTCNRDSQQLTVVSINSTTDIHSDNDRVCTVTSTLIYVTMIYAGHALPSPLQLTQATDHPLTQPTRTNLPTHPANEDQSPHSPNQRGPTSPLTQPTRTSLPATAVALGMTWIGS